MTIPIGHGVLSARAPTKAEPRMPEPYWIEPTSADTAPARSGNAASAPATELAMISPVAETNRNNGAAKPAIGDEQSPGAAQRDKREK